MKEEKETKLEKKGKKLVAKKDWLIVQNDERHDIKEGDDVSKLPKKFLVALKTENVI